MICTRCSRARNVTAITAGRIARGAQSNLCLPCSNAARHDDWQSRFWSKVEKTADCWLWRASLNVSGYGQFKLDGKMRRAHRVAYELIIGVIPEGMTLDHLCRVRECVNPEHLEPVTHEENMRRGYFANVTHCPAGHPYDERNTRIDALGHRFCRACGNAAARRYRERQAVA